MRAVLDRLLTTLVVAAAVNVAYLCWRPEYDFTLGPLHLVAHGLFKPMLILHSAFFLCVLARPAAQREEAGSARWFWPALALVGVWWLAITIPVNALFDEWNYRAYSIEIGDWHGVLKLFGSSQIAAWYRPLGFASLWLDRQIFDTARWGYHLQNVAVHLVNAALLYTIARRWRWPDREAAWAALFYAGAACVYEPVMWPSARFDLLAMAFTAAAMLLVMRYFDSAEPRWLVLTLATYTLAVMSKESGYAFPVILLLLCWRQPMRRALTALASTGAMTLALLALRWSVLHGIGGYTPGETSPHLAFSHVTVQSLLTKLFPVSLFVVNHVFPAPAFERITVALMAVLLAGAVLSGASTTSRQRKAALFAVLSTAPVVTLVSWLDVTAQHVRYIYMPAAFVMLVTAGALWNSRARKILLPAFLVLSLSAGAHNVWAYQETYAHSDALAAQLAGDVDAAHAAGIQVIGMPGEYNGVLFGQFQVMYRFEELRPGFHLSFLERENQPCPASVLCYAWQPETRELRRLP